MLVRGWRFFSLLMLLSIGSFGLSDAAAAEVGVPLFSSAPAAGGQIYSVPAASLPYLILFPFLPALLLSFSAFTRIAIVLFLLRQGLGSPSVLATAAAVCKNFGLETFEESLIRSANPLH